MAGISQTYEASMPIMPTAAVGPTWRMDSAVITQDSGRSYLFYAEYQMIRFIERNGYDISYISGVDTDRAGALPGLVWLGAPAASATTPSNSPRRVARPC